MKRYGEGEELKGAATFLASEASTYVTGIILPVDGGYLTI
jgi:2-deoxy-D-gluconate 3-dehydrogenase